MTTNIEIGTRVAFARAFLRSTAQFTGRVPFLRGKVTATSFKSPAVPELVTVRWDDGAEQRVNINNLVREDRIHLEAV